MNKCPKCGWGQPPYKPLEDVRFSCIDGRIFRGYASVQVSPVQMDLFEILFDAAGNGIDRDNIITELYCNTDDTRAPNVVATHVSMLRSKLRPLGLGIEHKTKFGNGSRLGRYRIVRLEKVEAAE